MKEFNNIKINEEFRPSPQFKKLYYVYLLLVMIFGVLTWYIPVLLSAGLEVILGISITIFASIIFVSYWIPKYYDTIIYKLTRSELIWRRGVWWKNTGIVPYNRITNIDISQGPISRNLGIASIKIQTAGYSGSSDGGRIAEITIEGVEQFEDLRELIMEFVRGKKPLATETYEEDINSKILNELVRIREIMEKSS